MSITRRSTRFGERISVVALFSGLFFISNAAALPCTPAGDAGGSVDHLHSTSGTIHPGEYQTIQKSVPSGVNITVINLDWSGHQHPRTDSPAQTITPPGSAALGPYRDTADGSIDEEISLTLSGSDPLPSVI